MPPKLDRLLTEIRACRVCVETPNKTPLPHEPNPVLRVGPTARIVIAGQAPGTRVHASSVPFTDPSGDRLRDWMDVTRDEFYDTARIAIVPMGFCFPGLDAKGGDLPPRPECAPLWRNRVFEHLTDLDLVLLIGAYAQRWHLGASRAGTLTETVRNWHAFTPLYVPLPHPSWRNNAWLKRNPWFEAEVLPYIRRRVRAALGPKPGEGTADIKE